mmetsp:Transcript_38505/g.39934  ORF Transcript_38505/g.39934 Transcript_38505/m.39934 type:complete len:590 (-) Transcript_38505:36-1805(-)
MSFSHSDCFDMVRDWINNSLDEIRNHINAVNYPLFVYLYIDLLSKNRLQESQKFFNRFSYLFPAFEEELSELSLIKDQINLENPNPIVSKYLKNKVHIYIPQVIFEVFLHFLTINHLTLILELINKFFEVSSLLSKVKDSNYVLLNLSSDELDKINCGTNIFSAKIKKDNDLQLKAGKRHKGEKSLLSKVIIPIPEQYYDVQALDNTTLKIDSTSAPTVGCFTILNSHNKMNCSDFSIDGSLIAIGLKDGQIYFWVLDKEFPEDISEDLIKQLEEYKETHYSKMLKGGEIFYDINNNQFNDNVKEENKYAYDEVIKKRRFYILSGHSEAVFSINFSPDNKYLVSGSFDETVRLWSTLTKQTLIVYKGHFSPILSVKFSPLCNYFASGGCDRTAKIWGLSSGIPLRQFSGHLSDVELIEFHPNGLYLITAANDKTVRLWCIETGDCVRVIYNYSEKGYVDAIAFTNSGKLMAIACDNCLIVYDVLKMGDPIRIVKNFSSCGIYSLCFDCEDSVVTASTENNELIFYDFHLVLNDQLPTMIDLNDYQNDENYNYMHYYLTKKTPIVNMKYTPHNVLVTLGRFDDNDPKIFM